MLTREEIKRSLTTAVSLLTRSKQEDERTCDELYAKGDHSSAVIYSGIVEALDYALDLLKPILAEMDK